MEENLQNKDEIYEILVSNENHNEFFNKNIVKIRKEYSTLNTNSSIGIVENDQKKINFEIKDNKNFLDKSCLQSNINNLKEKLNHIDKEKNRPNSSATKKLIVKKNKNLKSENVNTENNEKKLLEDILIFDKEIKDNELFGQKNEFYKKENIQKLEDSPKRIKEIESDNEKIDEIKINKNENKLSLITKKEGILKNRSLSGSSKKSENIDNDGSINNIILNGECKELNLYDIDEDMLNQIKDFDETIKINNLKNPRKSNSSNNVKNSQKELNDRGIKFEADEQEVKTTKINRNFMKSITSLSCYNKDKTSNKDSSLNSNSEQKIKFIVKKSTQNNKNLQSLSETDKSQEEDSYLELHFVYCYLCDEINKMNNTKKTEFCSHYVCLKCMRAYYEWRIEEKDYSLKCPIYFCKFNFNEEVIKKTISNHSFQIYLNNYGLKKKENLNIEINKLEEKKSNNNTKHLFDKYVFSNQKEEIDNFDKEKNIKNNQYSKKSTEYTEKIKKENEEFNIDKDIKNFNKKNLIELNNLEGFIKFNSKRENFCKKCNEPALFRRKDKIGVKCLNCIFSCCRYCLKQITIDHFDLNSSNYCRVYYRRKLKMITQKNLSKSKIYLTDLLMFIASYVLFMMNCFSILSKILKKITFLKKYKKQIKFFYFINENNKNLIKYFQGIVNKMKSSKLENKSFLNKKINFENRENNFNLNFENNLIINIEKNEEILSNKNGDNKKEEFSLKEFNKENVVISEELKNFLFENENKIFKEKIKIKEIRNFPIKDKFYFEEISENKNEKKLMCFKSTKKEENAYVKLSTNGNLIEIKENFFLKFLKNLIFYILFIPLGIFLLLILILILPYYPLIINIFQI